MTDATSASGVAGASSLDRVFEYDALYRLIQATGRESGQYSNYSSPYTEPHVPDNSASNTRAYTRNYEYDRIGNILKLNHIATGNTFNRWFNDFQNNAAAFQLSNLATEITFGSTTINYGFDANGNQISEGSSRSFEWDYGDRMRGFAEGTSVRAAYLYDAGGQRVKKIVTKSTGNTEVTVYIDGGFEYLYELDSSGTKDEEFNEFHVMDDRSRIARVKVFGSTWSGSTADEVRYNLEDHLGNSSFTVDDAGSLITREEYFPFGETSFGSFAKKRYRYNGKERDEESGLYYYGARYYATWTCRFISIDPVAGQMPFSSPYSYAANNPVVLVDVDGLAPGGGGGKDSKGGKSKSDNIEGSSGGSASESSGQSTGESLAQGDQKSHQSVRSSIPSEPEQLRSEIPTTEIIERSITPSRMQDWKYEGLMDDGLGEKFTSVKDGVHYDIYHQFGIEHDYHEEYATETSGSYYYRKEGDSGEWKQYYPKGYNFDKELTQTVSEFEPFLKLLEQGLELEVMFLMPGYEIAGAIERIAIRKAISTTLKNQAVKEGVYILEISMNGSVKEYVGQSKDIMKRLAQHFAKNGKFANGVKLSEKFISMPGSTKLEREAIEQFFINNKVFNNLWNKVNPMGGRKALYDSMIKQLQKNYGL